MKLSAEQFAELTASFNPAGKTDCRERRRAARIELEAQIIITPITEGRQWQPEAVSVADFSARGLAVLRPQQMEPGQQFITELPRTTGGRVRILCTVAHGRQVTPSMWRIGAEFTCVLNSATILPAGPDDEQMQKIRDAVVS